MNEHEWKCDWVSKVLPYFSPLTFCSLWVEGIVVVGSRAGTDSGTYASPPSYPVFLLSLNVVNECCVKASGQLLPGNGPTVCPESSYYTTTTTTTNSMSWELHYYTTTTTITTTTTTQRSVLPLLLLYRLFGYDNNWLHGRTIPHAWYTKHCLVSTCMMHYIAF